jgi:dipeptidyl aminopeptidase/acylaminoacyl peptidase
MLISAIFGYLFSLAQIKGESMRIKTPSLIIIFGAFLLMSFSSIPQLAIFSCEKKTKGTIFFHTDTDITITSYPHGLIRSYMVIMPERTVQTTGYSNESTGQAISNDGQLIALTCDRDNTSICIFNSKSLVDRTEIVPDSINVGYGDLYTKLDKKISLPTNCSALDGDLPPHQMSWSHDKKKLSIICGDKFNNTLLCVIEIDGKSRCFSETMDKKITYAAWSPVTDSLVVSSTTYGDSASPKVYMFDTKTRKFQLLFSGFAPAWSPNGDKIASFFVISNIPVRSGIQVYSLKEKRNTILLPNEQSKTSKITIMPYLSDVEDGSISWSPDEKQLVFSSYISANFSTLFLFDIETGDIEYLLDPHLLRVGQTSPQWSPFELKRK